MDSCSKRIPDQLDIKRNLDNAQISNSGFEVPIPSL